MRLSFAPLFSIIYLFLSYSCPLYCYLSTFLSLFLEYSGRQGFIRLSQILNSAFYDYEFKEDKLKLNLEGEIIKPLMSYPGIPVNSSFRNLGPSLVNSPCGNFPFTYWISPFGSKLFPHLFTPSPTASFPNSKLTASISSLSLCECASFSFIFSITNFSLFSS